MPTTPSRCLALALLAACALPLAGCVEAEETWTLGPEGGGTYALVLRWNADLWRRVGDVLGPVVVDRLQGRAFPLRPSAWRESLAGLEGLDVVELAERDTDTGMRELSVKVRFRHLRDLLRWELLARRTTRVETVKAPGAAADAAPRCRLTMEPIARVPVLDPLAALLEAVEKPPPAAEGAAAGRDPPPLERLGIEREAGELVWKMLRPQLGKVRLALRFEAPGELVAVRGRAPASGTKHAAFEFDFPALRKPTTDRTVRFTWQTRSFDKPPVLRHAGDRDPRPRGPTGRD